MKHWKITRNLRDDRFRSTRNFRLEISQMTDLSNQSYLKQTDSVLYISVRRICADLEARGIKNDNNQEQ